MGGCVEVSCRKNVLEKCPQNSPMPVLIVDTVCIHDKSFYFFYFSVLSMDASDHDNDMGFPKNKFG